MSKLYKGIAGSPITALVGAITDTQVSIAIADDTALPDAPNICTIGYGEHIETIRYGAKSNGVLQDVTRGIEGTPRAWASGTEVARFFTAYDHNAIIEGIAENTNDITTHKADNVTEINNIYNMFDGTIESALNTEIDNVKTELVDIAHNVKSFGAKGDGITDDVDAIQNALDYVENIGGGTVYLPKGVYKLFSSIYIGHNVNLIGTGKSTVLDGVGNPESGPSIIYPKYRGSSNLYDGASDFSIQNLAINSSTRTMQGIYLDNAKNFYIKNIWGLGTTLDHYLDINNSKDGLIENLYLIHDHLGSSDIQIDSREGENDGITIKNVYIYNPNRNTDSSDLNFRRAGIHFHRANSKNIYISNVNTENLDIVVYKDSDIQIDNVTIENVKVKNAIQPILWQSTEGPKSENLTFRNWEIDTDIANRLIGLFNGVDGLVIDNVRAKTNAVNHDDALRIDKSKDVGVTNSRVSGAHFAEITHINMSILSDCIEEINKNDSGRWTPELIPVTSGSITLSRADGWYSKVGKIVQLTGRVTIGSVVSPTGRIQMRGYPYKALEDTRPSGVISFINGYEGPPFNISMVDNDIRFYEIGTENSIDANLFNAGTYFSFNISYISE